MRMGDRVYVTVLKDDYESVCAERDRLKAALTLVSSVICLDTDEDNVSSLAVALGVTEGDGVEAVSAMCWQVRTALQGDPS
jgi:hypothetical protein